MQVTRVDLEARRIEFALVKGVTYASVQRELRQAGEETPRHFKRVAKPKPEALRGKTAQQRRAEAMKEAKQARNKAAKSPGAAKAKRSKRR